MTQTLTRLGALLSDLWGSEIRAEFKRGEESMTLTWSSSNDPDEVKADQEFLVELERDGWILS